MRTKQDTTQIKTGPLILILIVLTLLHGMATTASATPFDIFIENPGVWSITGSFESDTDTWTSEVGITNWSFTATTPTFTVGPLTMQQMNTALITFAGSTSTEMRNINVRTAGIATAIIFEVFPNLPSPIYNVRLAEPGKGVLFDQGDPRKITNTAAAIPEPNTVLLMITGLGGLAGYRWHHTRRERMRAREPAFYPSHV